MATVPKGFTPKMIMTTAHEMPTIAFVDREDALYCSPYTAPSTATDQLIDVLSSTFRSSDHIYLPQLLEANDA